MLQASAQDAKDSQDPAKILDNLRSGGALGPLPFEYISWQDNSGNRFLSQFGLSTNLAQYMMRARTNHIWDFKITNGTSKTPIPDIDIYRGMPITFGGETFYASARDVGNIAAGYVGGENGLSWNSFRFGCDSYQTLLSSLKNGAFSLEFEKASTTSAQRVGWERGNLNWIILSALRQ